MLGQALREWETHVYDHLLVVSLAWGSCFNGWGEKAGLRGWRPEGGRSPAQSHRITKLGRPSFFHYGISLSGQLLFAWLAGSPADTYVLKSMDSWVGRETWRGIRSMDTGT